MMSFRVNTRSIMRICTGIVEAQSFVTVEIASSLALLAMTGGETGFFVVLGAG